MAFPISCIFESCLLSYYLSKYAVQDTNFLYHNFSVAAPLCLDGNKMFLLRNFYFKRNERLTVGKTNIK